MCARNRLPPNHSRANTHRPRRAAIHIHTHWTVEGTGQKKACPMHASACICLPACPCTLHVDTQTRARPHLPDVHVADHALHAAHQHEHHALLDGVVAVDGGSQAVGQQLQRPGPDDTTQHTHAHEQQQQREMRGRSLMTQGSVHVACRSSVCAAAATRCASVCCSGQVTRRAGGVSPLCHCADVGNVLAAPLVAVVCQALDAHTNHHAPAGRTHTGSTFSVSTGCAEAPAAIDQAAEGPSCSCLHDTPPSPLQANCALGQT